METPEGLTHTLTIEGRLGREAAIECAGIFLTAKVRGWEALGEHFRALATSDPQTGVVLLEVKRCSTGWLPMHESLPALFSLCAAFREIGCLAKVSGPWERWMPPWQEASRTFSCLAAPSLESKDAHPRTVRPEDLREIHLALDGTQEVAARQHHPAFRLAFPAFTAMRDDLKACVTQHTSGLVVFMEGSLHWIMARPPALSGAGKDLAESGLLALSGLALRLEMNRDDVLRLATLQAPFTLLKQSMDERFRPVLEILEGEFADIDAHSDYGRYPRHPVSAARWTAQDGTPYHITYDPPVTLETLRDAGVPRNALLLFKAFPPSQDDGCLVSDWFTIVCGAQRLWCENATRRLIWSETPTVVYG